MLQHMEPITPLHRWCIVLNCGELQARCERDRPEEAGRPDILIHPRQLIRTRNALHVLAIPNEMTAVRLGMLARRIMLSGIYCKGNVLHAQRNETSIGAGIWLVTWVTSVPTW